MMYVVTRIVEELNFDTFRDFYIDVVLDGKYSDFLKGFIFRGENSLNYRLQPSSLREVNIDKLKIVLDSHILEYEHQQVTAEMKFIYNFYKKCNHNGLMLPSVQYINKNYFIDDDKSFFDSLGEDCFWGQQIKLPNGKSKNIKPKNWINSEWVEIASLAQHYDTLTRLLDWSFDLNTALYFACDNARNDGFALWALNTNALSNIYPLKLVVPQYSHNPNISAQKGVLSYWLLEFPKNRNNQSSTYEEYYERSIDRTPLDSLIEEYALANPIDRSLYPILYKITFNGNQAPVVKNFLERNGYKKASIFPWY